MYSYSTYYSITKQTQLHYCGRNEIHVHVILYQVHSTTHVMKFSYNIPDFFIITLLSLGQCMYASVNENKAGVYY